jgi:hypothetical protein
VVTVLLVTPELQEVQGQGEMLYPMAEQVLAEVEVEVAAAEVPAVIQVAALGVAEAVEVDLPVQVDLEILETRELLVQ